MPPHTFLACPPPCLHPSPSCHTPCHTNAMCQASRVLSTNDAAGNSSDMCQCADCVMAHNAWSAAGGSGRLSSTSPKINQHRRWNNK